MTLFAPRPLQDFLGEFRLPSAVRDADLHEFTRFARWLRRIGRRA